MDIREKLIEILRKPIFPHELVDPTEAVADYLLDNGVTVQEWISVNDRLPEEECHCLVIDAAGDIEIDCYEGKGRFVLNRSGAVQHPSHWMPLPKMPQPPKGE